MEDNDEDRISLGISDEEDEEDGEDFDAHDEEKRAWHRPEARSVIPLEASDREDDELSPSPPKRSRDQVSDMSGEMEAQDQEEGEIFSDESSVDEKSDGGGNVATRDHSPPDSYPVHEELSTSLDDRGDQIHSPGAEEKNDKLELEVSLSQENQDDSLFDYGSKDTEEIKDEDTSPADKVVVDNTSIERVRHYSSSRSSSSDSSVEKANGNMDQNRMDSKESEETDPAAQGKSEVVVSWESSASESSDDYKDETRAAEVATEIAFSRGNERLFEQREHPNTYQEVEINTSEGLFRPRKVKEKDDLDGKPVLDNSDDDYADPVTMDHLEITVPQRTASKERKIKAQKRMSEGSRSEAGQLVEDISDEDMQHEDVYANDRPRKMALEGSAKMSQEDQRSSKQGTSPSDSSKNRGRRVRDQDYKDDKKRVEDQRIGRQNYHSESSQHALGKKRSRDDDQEIGRAKRYDRHGSERDYGKARSHFDLDTLTERSLSKGDYEDERTSERQRAKSSVQMKSQVHVYSEISLRVESSEDDLRTKILKKQEAKHHYDRSESRSEYSRTQKLEKRVELKEGKLDIGSGKEKLSKKHSKERKAKKRSKYKEEKDLKRKKKHAGSKVKATAKEMKKGRDAKGSDRPKQRSEKERVSLKAKNTEGYDESSSDSEAYSEPESHHSTDENDLLDDNIAIDEDIQLRKTGSESGNEQEYDDISSADTDSPVPSPVELKKPPYFPAIQGCRSVEEFSWLNRIEEGTYGVVYRARDKRTDDIVALKRLKMEKEKEGFPITSLREINTLLKAQHPNIVTVREIVVGSNMDKIYIVMDYVAHDLKSLMEVMTQPFLVGEVKTLMIQLLRGVQHLHDNWILHRDIKTSNLLLSHNGILKIGDFGLAREYGSPLKLYTPIVVTLWYRAPELLLGMKEYSTAIDVWSVGCVFAELLMMKPLFPGKSEIDQLNRIFKELGTPNDKIWPGPPPFSELPMVKKTSFADHPYNVLRQRFGATLTDKGFNLLNRFLTYDPKKRITCDEALKHEYFKESPLPVDPAMFPTWPAKSEGHKVARKHNASPKPPEGGQYAQQMADDDPNLFGFHMPAPVKGVASKGPGFSLKF